jgi:hypothetical protein
VKLLDNTTKRKRPEKKKKEKKKKRNANKSDPINCGDVVIFITLNFNLSLNK